MLCENVCLCLLDYLHVHLCVVNWHYIGLSSAKDVTSLAGREGYVPLWIFMADPLFWGRAGNHEPKVTTTHVDQVVPPPEPPPTFVSLWQWCVNGTTPLYRGLGIRWVKFFLKFSWLSRNCLLEYSSFFTVNNLIVCLNAIFLDSPFPDYSGTLNNFKIAYGPVNKVKKK